MKFFSIKKWCLICLLLISGTLFSQITIDNTTYSTTQLVDGILVPAASGTVITNVTYGGVYNNSGDYQIAQFTTAGTTLAEMGFNEGVVLTSGNTNSIPLALGVDPRSTQIGGTYSSCTTGEIRESGTCGVSINDLNVLAGAQNYFNASVLEFDFVPVENSVTFRYIFGSEEYQDDSGFINYQCSSYNDKFGFLISGPGIINVPGQTYDNNAVNIALLNNGSEVSINSVNDGVVGSSGGAPNSANCLASNGAWIENTPTPEFLGTIDGTNMNGNTRILSATKTGLTPGQTYHIKLIVTDINDGTYDSVVYLEAGSFTTELSCNAGATQNLCNATFATLAATSPATGNWTVVSGPNTPTFTSATNPNSTVTGLINGNYVFRWTATDLSCFADVSINNGTTPATPTITSVAPTCIADGTSTISNYDGTVTYNFTPTGPTVDATGLISDMVIGTTYTVNAANASCASADTATFSNLIMLSTSTLPTITSVAPTCIADGTSTISNYDGTVTYNFTPTGPTVDATGLISGMVIGTTYTVNAANASCASADTATFSNLIMLSTPTLPTITSVAPTCIADGTSTISNYDGTVTYNFTPTGPSVDATGLISDMVIGTTYTVNAANASCASADTATFSNLIMLSTPTLPTITSVAPICIADGTSTISNYDGTVTYNFTPTGPSVDATGLISGMVIGTTYTVNAANASCASADTATFSNLIMLSTPTLPTITSVAPTCIANGTSTISNYDGTVTYNFTPTGPSVDATGLISGMVIGTTYTVNAANASCASANTATFSNLIMLSTPTLPTITSVAPTCIANGTSTISNYDGTVTYNFTPTGPTVDATGLISGMVIGTTYTVNAANASCASADTATFSNLIMLSTPTLPTITSVAPTCIADGTSTISNYDGTVTYNFTPTGPSVDATGLISGMVIGTTYTVNAANASCASADTATFSNLIMLSTPTLPTITSVAPTCIADGTSTISNYDGTVTYNFTPTGPTVDATGLISDMVIGTTYTVNAANASCASADTATFSNLIMLSTSTLPTITSVAPTCIADGTSTISNYDGTVTYNFTPTGPTVDATGLISGMVIGTTYTVNAANASCASADTATFSNLIMLSTPTLPTITSVAPTCIADGTSTISNYDGTVTYNFTPTGPTVDATGLISGMVIGTTYTVNAANASCASANSIFFSNLAILAAPGNLLATITQQPSCNNQFGTIEVNSPTFNPNEIYVLSGPDTSGTILTNSSDGVFSNLGSGDYIVYISNNNTGCVSNSIILTIESIPLISNINLRDGCNGTDYVIYVENPNINYSYNWYNSSGDLIGFSDQIIVTEDDTYEVQVSSGSCLISEFITINNAFCSIPNGLSPNGDGFNDTWELSNLDIKQVKIYNRYGTEIYSKRNYKNEWDGTSKGNKLPSGTYYYVIWFTNNSSKTGWVYLNR